MGDDKYKVRPLFSNRRGIDFDLEGSLPSHLNLGSARRTLNAWQSGACTDPQGRVWIEDQYLSDIWRTDEATAAFFVGGILPRDIQHSSGKKWINYSAVVYRLNEILQGPITNKRREYLRLSDIIGRSARDASEAEVLRLQNVEAVNDSRRQLKASRIRIHGLQSDELTGEPLDLSSCEFHHIRRQSGHTELIDMLWNGLIINKSTHALITANDIFDEEQLHQFCLRMSWSVGWYEHYRICLKEHYSGR